MAMFNPGRGIVCVMDSMSSSAVRWRTVERQGRVICWLYLIAAESLPGSLRLSHQLFHSAVRSREVFVRTPF